MVSCVSVYLYDLTWVSADGEKSCFPIDEPARWLISRNDPVSQTVIQPDGEPVVVNVCEIDDSGNAFLRLGGDHRYSLDGLLNPAKGKFGLSVKRADFITELCVNGIIDGKSILQTRYMAKIRTL